MPDYGSKDQQAESERIFGDIKDVVVFVVSLAMVLFHFYTAYVGSFTPMIQRGIHIALGFFLVFLLFRVEKKTPRKKIPLYDIFFALLSVVVFIYAMINFTEPTPMRMVYPTVLDKALGVVAILLVLEATRRTSGMALAIAVLCFMLYAFFGHHIPGMFGHAGIQFKDIISYNFMGLDGIFGIALGSSAQTIFVLVVVGITLMNIGGGDFILGLAYYTFGTVPGGPAKIAVTASALFSTISGTGPTIVAATGPFTIPLMKNVGYKPHFAAAVEAVASNGGQLMPPVMGAAAFIMAEVLGITYWKVCVSAIVPAILYFFSVYVMVHLEAMKTGLKGLPSEEIPDIKQVFKDGWYYVLPVILLISMIAYYESSPQRAGFYSMILLLGLEFLKQLIQRKWDIGKVIKAIQSGVNQAVMIITVVAAVGIIMSIMNMTGLGIRITSILVSLAHNILPILLIIAMVASLILGMGMSTVACYLIVSVLAAPAMVTMGVNPIAAHLFVFYFGIISAITPPVALSAYIAAGIADSPPMKTGWTALRLGLASFILPYMFVYSPSLIFLEGNFFTIGWSIITAVTGIFFFAVSLEGYLVQKLSIPARIIVFCGSLLLVYSGIVTDIAGCILIIAGLGKQLPILFRRLMKRRLLT